MALDFNGSTQYLRLTSAVLTGVPLTLFGRYRNDTAMSDGNERTILSLTDADAQQEFTIEIGRDSGTDYAIAMINQGGTVGFALSSTPPSINTWENIAGVYTSSTSMTVYLNGVNVGSDTTSATPTGISDICAGGTLSSSSPIKLFNGALADLAAWNVALTPAEIASLNAGVSPLKIRPQSLVFYVPAIRETTNYKGSSMTNVNTASPFAHPRIYMPSGIIIPKISSAGSPSSSVSPSPSPSPSPSSSVSPSNSPSPTPSSSPSSSASASTSPEVHHNRWLLDGTPIPRPSRMYRESIFIHRDFVSLNGRTTRDFSAKKEEFVLEYDYLTQGQFAVIYNIVTQNEAVLFQVAEDNLTINSTLVFAFIPGREYPMPGGSFIEKIKLTLIEVS